MNILMTGATGLIGTALARRLSEGGHELTVLTRNRESARRKLNLPCHFLEVDLNVEPVRDRALEKVEGVINLVGETVLQSRWSRETKLRIYNSRVQGTRNLLLSLRESPVQVFISTSAAGFYGDRGDETLTENSPAGSGFLSEVCLDWERPIAIAESDPRWQNCRFVIFRLPMVLSREGGGLSEMLPFFKRGLGGAIGDGKNWIPWIHIHDLVEKYGEALKNPDFRGVYNVCSPFPVQNLHFSQALAQALGKRLLMSIPAMALRLRYGEMAHVLLSSQRMVPEHLISQQSPVRYDTIEKAMGEIFGGG